MHQIVQIELRNAKFPYARGLCPLATPPRASAPFSPTFVEKRFCYRAMMLSKVCTKSRKFSSEIPNFPSLAKGLCPLATPALDINFTAPQGGAILDPPVSVGGGKS